MIMAPASTSVPSKAFTPRRLERLSRPLRELPTPFLCAIACSLRRRGGELDLLHQQPAELLAMSLAPSLVFFRLISEDDQLPRLDAFQQPAANYCPGDRRLADQELS